MPGRAHRRSGRRDAAAARRRGIDELWLDFDLGRGATVTPLLDELASAWRGGTPYRIGCVVIHTSSAVGGHAIRQALRPISYRLLRIDARRELTWH